MKKYNIYCDESSINNKDLLFMWIWAIQVEREYKNIVLKKLKDLKEQYNYNLEIKWRKVSPKTKDFYIALVDFFFENNLNFYSIIIDKEKLNLKDYHNDDEELAFYKYYYFLLKNKFQDWNEYYLYLDQRIKKDKDRIKKISEFFDYESQSRQESFNIRHIWEYDSNTHLLIQLSDFFIWAVCYNNNDLNSSETKKEVVKLISSKLNQNDLKFSSRLYDEKFNIFRIKMK